MVFHETEGSSEVWGCRGRQIEITRGTWRGGEKMGAMWTGWDGRWEDSGRLSSMEK